MARRIIGLDLGAYSVKVLRLETGRQQPSFEILDQSEVLLAPEEENGPDLLERQREAILKLYREGLLEAEVYSVGLNAADGQVRKMTVPFEDARKIEAVLPGLLEAEVPFDIDTMIIPWHRQEGTDTKIRLALGKKEAIASTLQLLQTFSIDPRQMHLASSAPYELVRELGLGSDDDFSHAIIDFGHRTTNLCIFDRHGLLSAHTFLRGGKKLTHDIAAMLSLSFSEAEALKHEKLNSVVDTQDQIGQKIKELAHQHYRDLAQQIARIFIAGESKDEHKVTSIAFIGGAAQVEGLDRLLLDSLHQADCQVVSLADKIPKGLNHFSMALALSYALGCLHVHTKDSRFNFRKDDFAWRGELDFLRTKSVPLILWSLGIICSLTVMWSAMSLVSQKDNKIVEEQIKSSCAAILGKPNIIGKKCLTMMKEQISSNTDLGIPEFTASDVYLKTAEALPKDIKITVTEMDILEKKVRIAAESPSFEDIDKVAAILSKIPCFVKVEKGPAQQKDKLVKYNLSNDIDCSAPAQQTIANKEVPSVKSNRKN